MFYSAQIDFVEARFFVTRGRGVTKSVAKMFPKCGTNLTDTVPVEPSQMSPGKKKKKVYGTEITMRIWHKSGKNLPKI